MLQGLPYPDAPARYVVQPGDTLENFRPLSLQPVAVERLWGANRSEIRNPHLIYPGQVLALSYVNGQPRLGFEGAAAYQDGIPVVKLTPRVRKMSAGYGIQTVNVNFYRMFMQHPQVIPQLQNARCAQVNRRPRQPYAL